MSKGKVHSVRGIITVENNIIDDHSFNLKITSPENCDLVIVFPVEERLVKNISNSVNAYGRDETKNYKQNESLQLTGGSYQITVFY